MAFWMLAMLAYPETQARAHAELDAVVGRARLPTLAHYQHLRYIRAMVKELLRWRPIVPLITPHRSTQDDWYEGMFLPKGTVCTPNAWHMNPAASRRSLVRTRKTFDPALCISKGPWRNGTCRISVFINRCDHAHRVTNLSTVL